MPLRQGVGSEILISLALVMATGTALLAAVLLEIDASRIEVLHGLLGRGFVASSRGGIVDFAGADLGHWWAIDGRGGARGLNVATRDLDGGTRALARESLAVGQPLVESGAPWEPIRFAAPESAGEGVLAGRIDAPVPIGILAVVLVADVVVFVAFGWTLMRRRIGGPLHRLVGAVREIGAGEGEARVPIEGVAEIQELGRAFNDMQVALAARTGALEKAVHELRGANAQLLQAREGLDRAERLALVGSLAAGVAHEVGNPMGAMLAFLDVAGRDPGLRDESRRCLERASEQGDRVRVILRQLLDFSRPPRIERGPLDLADVADRVIELVAAQHASDGIALERVVCDGVVAARGDLGLALQILLNLVLNAVSAVRDLEDRRIRLVIEPALRRRRSGEGSRLGGGEEASLPRVDAIVCRVDDSGPGVPAEHVDRIFAPFFTTKPPGEGTGLGLANARRLAEEMGGTVELDASPSAFGGASFRFVLPVAESAEAAVGVRSAPDQSRMS